MGLQRRPKKLNREELWNFALSALGQRAQSASEIRQKLLRRAASPDDVPATMAKLREYGLADDRRFSDGYATLRLQNRGFGRGRVLQDLKSKRVPDQIASAAVESAYAGTDERELIQNFLARKYRGKNLGQMLKDPKHLASVFRRLRTAGFGTSTVLTVLRGYSNANAEDWPEADGMDAEPTDPKD